MRAVCRGCVVCALALGAFSGCSQPQSRAGTEGPDAWFVEESLQRGIVFNHRSGFSGQPLLPEIVGGGAALADVDGDGDLDAYLVQSGWNLAEGSTSDSPVDQLFVNRGDGYFEAAQPGAADSGRGYGMGVTAGDYDNDGDVDLYVTNVGPNTLLNNDGSGRFENVAVSAGVDDPGWSTAAALLDFDADGDLDLFVVNYINWSLAVEKDCFARGRPTYCAPNTYSSPTMDRLYRNDGDGTFTDVTLAAGLNRRFGNGLGVVGADFDGDGRIDLFVANDGMADQLWLNKGNLTFIEEAALWGSAVNNQGVATAGMGVAAADVDDDGDTDLLVVNFENEADSFYLNEGGYFRDVTAQIGIAAATRKRTRFGVALVDFDNDGRLDLFESNGKVDGDPAATPDPFAEPNMLFRGRRGADGGVYFDEVKPAAGLAKPAVFTSRALAVGDVDDDGGLDLLIVNRDGPAHLVMNRIVERGASLRLRIVTTAGSDALGATVSAHVGTTTQRRIVTAAGSYLAGHDPRVHFGLGDEEIARDITVQWVDGTLEAFGDFDAGTIAQLQRGSGRVVAHPSSERIKADKYPP
jgi:hypothetical protein